MFKFLFVGIGNAVSLFLSGGISLENLQNLKSLNQKPLVLDINSKFEIEPGIKDIEKIKNFTQIVKKIY
jgi:phosphoribosylanthranilate isomerase